MADDSQEPTDLDLITDHLYVPSEWGDICGYTVNGWPCGAGLADHAEPEPEVARG